MDHAEAVETLAPERYLMNEMTVEDREAFEDHYFGCAECAADLRAGSAVIAGVRSQKAARQPKRLLFWLPSAVAAGLAVFVGYRATIGGSQPIVIRQHVPLTLSTSTFRNSAAEVEIQKVNGALPFALKFDIEPVKGAAGFDLEIVDGHGTVVHSDHVSATDAQNSVEIVVPGGKLRPGRYTVNVKPQPSGQRSFVSFVVQ